jgi:hypothetical protein
MPIALPDPLARLLAFVARALTVCLLVPVVVLAGLSTLAGLAVVGSARLVRSRLPSWRPTAGLRPAADIHLYPRAAAEGIDGAAARRAA